MVVDLIVWIVILGGLAAVGAATLVWPRILKFAEANLLPWIDEHRPELSRLAREALVFVDQGMVVARQLMRAAWVQFKKDLLSSVLTYVRMANGDWAAIIESIVRTSAQARTPQVVMTRTVVAWDELPQEVRSEWLKNEAAQFKIDVRKQRDDELELVH